MLWELPFVKEAESAHAEGQYRRNGGRSSEESRGAENSAIAPKGCGQVNLLGEKGRKFHTVRVNGGFPWFCV